MVLNIGSREDFYFEIADGGNTEFEIIHKFGRNINVGTTAVPIATSGFYQVPTAAVTLEAISSDANDTAAGTGARIITVLGLDGNFAEIEEDISMNGVSASSATTNSFIRVFRAFVKESGTYASQTAGSHQGDITIRASGGGATYATIDTVGFPRGQTQIAAYTVPAGKEAFVKNIFIHVDSNKSMNVLFFQRAKADDVSSPYPGS